LDLLYAVAAKLVSKGLAVIDPLHAVAAHLLALEPAVLRLPQLVAADPLAFDIAQLVAANLLAFDAPHLVAANSLALDIAHALAAIHLDVGVAATTLLEGEALAALRLHLEALASTASVALEALDLEAPVASAATTTTAAHLESLASTAAAALHVGLATTVASAPAIRPGFRIVVAMATAGLGHHGTRDCQRRNAGRQK
jgi:hypothetical protein